MGFPRFLPNRDILCFAHERLIEPSKNLEREVQLDPFLGGDSNYYYKLEEFMVGLVGLLD
jgi:hypothetical protein